MGSSPTPSTKNKLTTKIMGWLVVDKDGTEKFSINKPYRFVPKGIWYCYHIVTYDFSKLKNYIEFKPLVQKHKQTLISILPKGTIKKLINYELTWKDKPVEYK